VFDMSRIAEDMWNLRMSLGSLRRRRCRRMLVRRLYSCTVSLSLCVSMTVQQSRADDWILGRTPPLPDRITPLSSVFEVAMDRIQREFSAVSRRWTSSSLGRISGSPPTIVEIGAPPAWHAGDQAGPYSIANLQNGNLFTSIPIVSWDNLSFSLYHNSRATDGTPTGASGWRTSYSDSVSLDGSTLTYVRADGREITFDMAGDPATGTNDVYRLEVTEVGDSLGWLITDAQYNVMNFDDDGKLVAMADASGVGVKVRYNENVGPQSVDLIAEVQDFFGRTLKFAYDANDQLAWVEAPPYARAKKAGSSDAVERRFEFDFDASGRLSRIYSPRREDRASANPPMYHIAIGYSGDGQYLKSMTDYEQNKTSLFFTTSGQIARVVKPATYDFILGREVATARSYTYDDEVNCTGCPGTYLCTSVTDERGGISCYGFEDSLGDNPGAFREACDQLGRHVGSIEWNEEYRMTSSTSVLGGVTTLTYDAAGNVLTVTSDRTDTTTATTTYTYDSQGSGYPNRLTRVEDPLGNQTRYLYEDAVNPIKPTAIIGPGGTYSVATTQDANMVTLSYGSGSSDLGEISSMSSPNGIVQSFTYDRGNEIQNLTNNENINSACDSVSSESSRQQTGETLGSGRQSSHCERLPAARPPVPIRGAGPKQPHENSLRTIAGAPEDCETINSPSDCPICGCVQDLDESGQPVGLFDDDLDPENECEDPYGITTLAAVVPYDENVYCYTENPTVAISTCQNDENADFGYDGNGSPVCMHDRYIGRTCKKQGYIDVRYDFQYDAMGRMLQMDIDSTEHPGGPEVDPHSPKLYPSAYVFPSYGTIHEYSDTTGQFRTTYSRMQFDDLTSTLREIKTYYRTDAVGRVISVERDGKGTTYEYADSTVEAAITETRPDGSRTEIYVDIDGQVRGIVHADAAGVFVAQFTYTRDLKGRIVEVLESTWDPILSDTLRARVVYTYGDGNLLADDLDDPFNPAFPQDVPNPDRLYYDFLADIGPDGNGVALLDGHPHRLVSERRVAYDADDIGKVAEYQREYWYDHGGNRLVMRETDPVTDEVMAVTRYNYFFRDLATGADPYVLPGTPRVDMNEIVMDYDTRGRNKLLSSQTYYPQDPNRMDVVDFGYTPFADYKQHVDPQYEDNISGKRARNYRRDDVNSDWYVELVDDTAFRYFNGQLGELVTTSTDYCDSSCGTCPCAPGEEVVTRYAEVYTYDVFGRRVAKLECDKPCIGDASELTGCPDPPVELDEFALCQGNVTHYDYDGLSRQVVAERRSPLYTDVVQGEPALVDTEDRYLSSYLYGPLGVIARTAEQGDNNEFNNLDHYYLSDAMGGHVGILVDDGLASTTARQAQFVVYDAFGNEMAESSFGVGLRASFAWRGQEGSAKDIGSNLVYMQNRHYDPSIGRFIQADDLLTASLTTQGMNRYIYTENDPVNKTDPTGKWGNLIVLAIVAIVIFLLLWDYVKAVYDWFLYLWVLANQPKRCINENSTRVGDPDTIRNFQRFPNLPGTPGGGPISTPSTDPVGAVVDAVLRFLGIANQL